MRTTLLLMATLFIISLSGIAHSRDVPGGDSYRCTVDDRWDVEYQGGTINSVLSGTFQLYYKVQKGNEASAKANCDRFRKYIDQNYPIARPVRLTPTPSRVYNSERSSWETRYEDHDGMSSHAAREHEAKEYSYLSISGPWIRFIFKPNGQFDQTGSE